ncbi:MAG: hypothetical protein AB7V39_05835 [Nitrospiraceae bacterium]
MERKFMRVGAFTAVLGLLLLAVPRPGVAAPVTFEFTGLVTNVSGDLFTAGGTGANGFRAGLPLTGSYTFNSLTPDTSGNPAVGEYTNAISNMTMTIGDYTATFNPGTSIIRVTDRPFVDLYEVQINGLLGNSVKGFTPTIFNFELQDPSANAFSNTALPTLAPSVSSFASAQWRMIFGAKGRTVEGGLSSLVPLPAAVWLFGAGLVALIGLGSRGPSRRSTTA